MGVLDVLVPLRCAVCAALGEPLCPTCAHGLVPLVPPVCERCGAPGAWPVRRCAECAGRRLGFTSARAAIVYDIRAKALVNAWKEHGRRDLARVAATIVAATLPRPSADLLTFVPSDAGRLLTRGHGPAERLAREIGRLWGLRTRTLLIRTRSVSRQRGLSLADRRRNVHGAFTTAGAIRGRVVLVDDVYTTGATASACATALRRAGATDVEVICLARAIR